MSDKTEFNALELAAIHNALLNYLDHLQSGNFDSEDIKTYGEILSSKSALEKTEKMFNQKVPYADVSP